MNNKYQKSPPTFLPEMQVSHQNETSVQTILFIQGSIPNRTIYSNLSVFNWYCFLMTKSGNICLYFLALQFAALKELLEWIVSKHWIISTWIMWSTELSTCFPELPLKATSSFTFGTKFDFKLEDLTLLICFELSPCGWSCLIPAEMLVTVLKLSQNEW